LLLIAEGIKESLDKEAQLFSQQILALLGALIKAVRNVRDTPPADNNQTSKM